MASLNVKLVSDLYTYEGAKSSQISAKESLKRAIMSCMLWENSFYEDGISISDRIEQLIPKVKPQDVFDIAVKARVESKLRHVPLLIARIMCKYPTHKSLVGELLTKIIQRPDELTEFLAIYWKDGKIPLANQVKTGLGKAFKKFNEYSLAKYNRDGKVKLRDVLFMTHPKPDNNEQELLWKKLVDNKLAAPDTWEVSLSAGKEPKKYIWERLLNENKLGALALLRNMRNIISANVSKALLKNALVNINVEKILPFRFISAAKYAPDFEPELESAMIKCLSGKEKLPYKTLLLIDVSGSMKDKISSKSELTRMDAACGLAILARELCEYISIYSFSTYGAKIPLRRGFALRDAIVNSQPHAGTDLDRAINSIQESYDRLIVITDEQSSTKPKSKVKQSYIINVSICKNGVGYGDFIHINGWSENVFDYISSNKL